MATGDRTQKIYGRVYRILTKQKGLSADAYQKPEIYDELNEGQKQVMLRVPVEAVKTIAMIASPETTDYTLVVSNREVYGSIVRFIRPSTWDYEIKYVYPAEWDYIVNSGEYDDFANPVRATIFANTLKLYPAPTAVVNLTIHALLKMPATEATDSVDPETPEDFDAAIGDWILWKILGDPVYFESFKEQIEAVGNVNGFKGFLIQKPRITW